MNHRKHAKQGVEKFSNMGHHQLRMCGAQFPHNINKNVWGPVFVRLETAESNHYLLGHKIESKSIVEPICKKSEPLKINVFSHTIFCQIA